MDIELQEDGRITLRGYQFYEAKTQAIRWKKIGKEWEEIFWVRGKWLDPKKEKKHKKERRKALQRLQDDIDTHSSQVTHKSGKS
eukprot:symbB.v1.2.013866.t1/scaffold991.1/size149480/1